MSRNYTTEEFAKLVNRKPRTLYLWARQSKLVPKKDFSGRNVYTDDDLAKVLQLNGGENGGSEVST